MKKESHLLLFLQFMTTINNKNKINKNYFVRNFYEDYNGYTRSFCTDPDN